MRRLPVDAVVPELKCALREQGSAVLAAEPGAGKTTRIPLALLEEPWLEGRRIVMLEPRRLAARMAARYMAMSLGESVGGTIGFRTREETRCGPHTRVEVITEGILVRMLQHDPALEQVGLVIFDEFHERSLHADLGLALVLQARSMFRSDLRILVMSATLDEQAASALLGGAPVIRCEGRSYPVETRYLEARSQRRPDELVVQAVERALSEDEGDVLVFLPGIGDIHRVQERLADALRDRPVRTVPLHGQLPAAVQDEAIAPAPDGMRKIVLSTSIAETSLTVEGIGVVIDSGWMRVPRFSPRTGMSALETVRVSLAAADQRRGRAGRLGPGVCYRLWSREEERRFPAHTPPEILHSDLTGLALELAVWGAAPEELHWIDPPPASLYRQACELLRELGALDANGAATAHGRKMAETGLHPRLAHMMLEGVRHGLGTLASELAALLGERDVFVGESSHRNADLRLRVEALRGGAHREQTDEARIARVRAEAARLRRQFGLPSREKEGTDFNSGNADEVDRAGMLLACAFPDRIGMAKGSGRFLLSNGRGAELVHAQPLSAAQYVVVPEVDDQGQWCKIYRAAPVTAQELETALSDRIVTEHRTEWDREQQAVKSERVTRIGALVLRRVPDAEPDLEQVVGVLLDAVRSEGLAMLPWSKAAIRLRQRMAFLYWLKPDEWPDVSDEGLLASLDTWLAPHVYGMKSRADLQRLRLEQALETLLDWEQKQRLEAWAPTHWTVPSGSRIAIDYRHPDQPFLAVRLQEVFGLRQTPRIGGGRVPLTMHLLSPAMRPVQVTRDLESFWKHGYFEVKKELKGRYPKHDWPDDPETATPVRGTRPPARRNGNSDR